MKILALDPGALRCGWALLQGEGGSNKYVTSGILGLTRTVNYQVYRIDLIKYWVNQTIDLFDTHFPEVVVSEIVPPTGGNISGIINRQLSLTVITTVQAMTAYHGHEIAQLSASTVKQKIAGNGRASKVKIRDGVLSRLPELETRRKEWTGKAVWDEVDAIAIGLTYMEGIHRG